MAKPKPDFPASAAIRALADSEGRLAFRVTPASRMEALEIGHTGLIVKIRAKPQDGKATAAAMELIADALGMATSRLRLLRGATSREKLVQIID